jgi:putative peptide zinc metalloprotease protein
MNIANALSAALPELPERVIKRSVPKLDPRVIAKEQVEHGRPTVLAKLPGAENFIRLDPPQWVLLQLFDGERSYEAISREASARTGIPYSEDDVREFASFLQANTDLFYKSPLEKNVALQQKLRGQRMKRKRAKKAIDFNDIAIADWPHADNYISRIYPHLRWVFTWWFTLIAVSMFIGMSWMWVGRFGEIWSDSFQFYNFTTKSASDLLEFWLLFGAMAFFHESFHGLTCKHFGGNVEGMGFTLMYFAPSFYCDVTQVWIYGGKWERIATAIAGIWGDLIICFFATTIWWATSPGMAVHNLAYKVMMVTGIGVSVLNLNPLIKLDGYYIFCELIGKPDFKESTSAYLSAWTRKHVFGLPAELEYVPKHQRPFHLLYAILSELYGYALLAFLMVLTYNIIHSYSPDWAFVPAAVIGYWVFRARIHSLGQLIKLIYLDKKESALKRLTPLRSAALAIALLLLLFAPIWPDFQDGSFVLEPTRQALVHAPVRGRVSDIFVDEGQRVVAGQLLARLENVDLQTELARTRADLQVASSRATQSQIHYWDYGTAERERLRLLQQEHSLREEADKLQITSPITGMVATARVHDLIGGYLDEGAPLLELIDDSSLEARIFVPEFAMHDIHPGTAVRLHVVSRWMPVSGTVHQISADWMPLDASLGEKEQLAGINPPRFFVVKARLDRGEDVRPGMTGIAKIRVGRRSLANLGMRFTRDLLARRLW